MSEFAALVNPNEITSILSNAEHRNFFISARETMLGPSSDELASHAGFSHDGARPDVKRPGCRDGWE